MRGFFTGRAITLTVAAALGAGLAGGVAGCRNTTRTADDVAADAWSSALSESGLPNLHKVSDDLYRGAQPSRAGLHRLEDMGIKTVVNVRGDDTDRERLADTDLRYHHWPMSGWSARDEDVIRFLKIVTDRGQSPVFLHCRHGADRTGFLVAMYRVCVQDWPKENAIDEMTRGGTGFLSVFDNLVDYVRDADVDGLRRAAGFDLSRGHSAADTATP